jgi:hypothetical protein
MSDQKPLIREITEFSPDLKNMSKPGRRVRVRIFCQNCQRHHILHFGEFQNALSDKPRKPHNLGYGKPVPESLQGILDFYSHKYCRRGTRRSGSHTIRESE